MPLTLEDKLLDELGEIARVEPDGLHCRWAERNAEFCQRLEASVGARRQARPRERWQATSLPLGELERGLGERILGERGDDLAWCLDCGAVGEPETHAGHEAPFLFGAGEVRTLAVWRDFLAIDPLDTRLLEREGERAVLERLRHGDFGDAYRDSWRAHAFRAGALLLRTEIRGAVRSLRSSRTETDFHFTAAKVVLSHRTLA